MAIFKFFDECVHTRIGRGLVWPLLSRKHFFITVDLLLIDAAFYDFAIFCEITFNRSAWAFIPETAISALTIRLLAICYILSL